MVVAVELLSPRERFLRVAHFQRPDRVPIYDQDPEEDTLRRWWEEGLPRGVKPSDFFTLERWEQVGLNLDMIPEFEGRLKDRESFERLKACYNVENAARYPAELERLAEVWRRSDYPLGIEAWPSFFLSLNVSEPRTLTDILVLSHLQPEFVGEMTQFVTDFTIGVLRKVLEHVNVDYAVFSEPIADNRGPVLTPRLYRELVAPCYRQIVAELRGYGVDVFIVSTLANVNRLIPIWLECGINGLWCRETKAGGMDYVELKRHYGDRLLLLGGLDVDMLIRGKAAIEEEMVKARTLLSQRGCIPFADNRARPYVPFESYAFYRRLLNSLAAQSTY